MAGGGRYAVVFDPLDGSRNIECSIPTGTIFGIYSVPEGVISTLWPFCLPNCVSDSMDPSVPLFCFTHNNIGAKYFCGPFDAGVAAARDDMRRLR